MKENVVVDLARDVIIHMGAGLEDARISFPLEL